MTAPTAPDLEGTLILERLLVVDTGAGTARALPAGTAIGVASTDVDDTLTVLVVDPFSGRAEPAGVQTRGEIEAALTPAPAPTLPAGVRPVRDLSLRLRRIARKAEAGAGWRGELATVVADLRGAGRTGDAELLLVAAGKPGTAYAGGASYRIAQLATTLAP